MIVKDKLLLKAMQRKGHITLHSHTGKTVYWNGQKLIAWYVDDGKYQFTHEGQKYETKYVDGCFFPYVFEV